MSGYDEAVAWFRADPGRVRDLDDVDNRSAAIAIVNAVLAGAVPAGRDLTAQDELRRASGWFGGAARKLLLDRADELDRIARPSGGVGHPVGVSEAQPDEHRDWVPGVGRHDPMSQPPDEWLDYLADLPGRSTVWSPDPSPRSWSLPAPPPDDVTRSGDGTEYRVCGIHPQRGHEVADYFESLSMAREQVQHCAEDGWTDVVIESRTVSTTTRTTDWKADEQ